MQDIPSSIFWVLIFHHEGEIIKIDQLSYTKNSTAASIASNIPLIGQTQPVTQSLGVGMYPSHMVTFNLHTPINYISSATVRDINIIYRDSSQEKLNKSDIWILPTSLELDEDS